jgi:HSP20 family molecular chaperone IbpA
MTTTRSILKKHNGTTEAAGVFDSSDSCWQLEDDPLYRTSTQLKPTSSWSNDLQYSTQQQAQFDDNDFMTFASAPLHSFNDIELNIERAQHDMETRLKDLESRLFPVAQRHLLAAATTTTSGGTNNNEDNDDLLPLFKDLGDGRKWIQVQVNARGFSPDNIRIRTAGNQLMIDAYRRQDVVNNKRRACGYESDSLSRTFVLPGRVRAADLRCVLTSGGVLCIDGIIQANNQLLTGTANSRKQVKFSPTVLQLEL